MNTNNMGTDIEMDTDIDNDIDIEKDNIKKWISSLSLRDTRDTSFVYGSIDDNSSCYIELRYHTKYIMVKWGGVYTRAVRLYYINVNKGMRRQGICKFVLTELEKFSERCRVLFVVGPLVGSWDLDTILVRRGSYQSSNIMDAYFTNPEYKLKLK